ncbi:MAG: bis(5'-nucleosyl)-tetraphosphatase [Candidatus Anstonellaceae archaeon]
MEQSRGFILFRKENSKFYFLILKYRAGHWDFPRGHVEQNEDELQAALRELEEETSISSIKILDGFSYSYEYDFSDNRHKKVTLFLAKTTQKSVKLSDEHVDWRWEEFENALKLLTYPHPKEALKKAMEFLEKLSS